MHRSNPLWSAAVALLIAALPAIGVEVVTQHFDNGRTGANTQETALTPGNVSVANFGKLYTLNLDANVNGQALYVPNLSVNGGTHNVVYAYTSNSASGPCSVYAFDADSGTQLWHLALANSDGKTTNTPVIDTAIINGTRYMYLISLDGGKNRLHAIDIRAGTEGPGSPVAVSGSFPGTANGGTGTVLNFPAGGADCRPGMLLVGGNIICGFACLPDPVPWHGWVISYTYNGTTLSPKAAFCVTPDLTPSSETHGYSTDGGGFWATGKGLASDGTYVYGATGNGNFTATTGGNNYSMCFLKLNLNTLAVVDWFAPFDEYAQSNGDGDLGSSGPVLIPGTSMMYLCGKSGRGNLVSTTSLGHFNASADACLQSINGQANTNSIAWTSATAGTCVYSWGGFNLRQMQAGATTLNATYKTNATNSNYGSICISANGTGNGIVWVMDGNNNLVRAYNASDVSQAELWNSNQNSARDALGSTGHWQFPMVAAGKVFVPDGNGHLLVYGLLSTQTATKLAFVQQPTSTSTGAAIAPAVTVVVQDSTSATVTGSSASVTIAIGANPGAGTLAGTLTATAVNGIATFSNLSINNLGTGYTLVASSSGLTGATSAAFNITGVTATPTFNPNGGTYSGPVTVLISDATAGATIYYTTNGSTPTTASTLYNPATPPVLGASGTIKAIATAAGLSNSAVATSGAFTISGATAYGMPYRPVVSGLNVPATNTSPPATLSATNVFSNLSTLTPAAGIVPFGVNTPLWSDNALKRRWIALPGSGKIGFQPTGSWTFPGGTIFIKHFELGTNDTDATVIKRLETRLLVLNGAGTNGYGITYQWRADNSNADLVAVGGLDQAITIATAGGGTRSQTWHYPSQNECLTCHTTNAGFVLGPKTGQLNGSFTYPSSGVTDNQLRTWNYLQMFTTNIGEGNIAGFQKYAPIGLTSDATGTLQNRVKSYLDANCGQCHRPGGVAANWDARYETPLANQSIIYGQLKNQMGIAGACTVVPQDTAKSMMHLRMNLRGANQMPPLASNVIDANAVAVLDQWIGTLTPASPAITSAGTASGTVGAAFGYTITASNGPVSFAATTLPAGLTLSATTGAISGTPTAAGATSVTISATNGGGTGSATLVITITGTGGTTPTITSFTPASGPIGTTVVITGTNLTGATSVKFNGTTASVFTMNSSTSITATVPTGATTGKITATTAGGTATSAANFTVILAPTITAVTPATGTAGTAVTITGTNLSGATAVRFNGTTATFAVNGAGTQITTTVPAGATNGTISVTTPGGTATSTGSFTTGISPPASASSGKCGGGLFAMVGLLLLVVAAKRWRLVPGR